MSEHEINTDPITPEEFMEGTTHAMTEVLVSAVMLNMAVNTIKSIFEKPLMHQASGDVYLHVTDEMMDKVESVVLQYVQHLNRPFAAMALNLGVEMHQRAMAGESPMTDPSDPVMQKSIDTLIAMLKGAARGAR